MGHCIDPETGERLHIEPGHLRPKQHVTTAALKQFLLELVRTYRGLPIDVDAELTDAMQRAWLVDLHRAWGAWVEPWWVEQRIKRGDRVVDVAAE